MKQDITRVICFFKNLGKMARLEQKRKDGSG